MNILKRLFFESYWMCGYRTIEDADFNINTFDQASYEIIPISNRYWIADPFVFEHDERLCLFVEMYDRYKTKAAIGMMEYIDGHFSELKAIYEFDCHTSYPCVFEYNDEIYMIPETKENREIVLLKCNVWPYVWTQDTILLNGIDAVDTTVFIYNDKLKIFIYEMMNEGDANLYIADLNMGKKLCENLMLINNYNCYLGRPGGGVIEDSEGYIRVVQQGNNYYGERLEFYRFNFTNDKYEEKIIGGIDLGVISTNSKQKFLGIHTLNRCKRIEVVDLLIMNKFSPFKPIVRLLKMLGIPPFYLGDKKKEKCFDIRRSNENELYKEFYK